MSVGVLLITHGRIGQELLAAATHMLGTCPRQVRALAVSSDADPDALLSSAREILGQLDQGQGVLVLTDLFGSTPCNIAAHLCDGERYRVLSGVNLPMLVRALNYRDLALPDLADKAASGALDGVVACTGPGHAAERISPPQPPAAQQPKAHPRSS